MDNPQNENRLVAATHYKPKWTKRHKYCSTKQWKNWKQEIELKKLQTMLFCTKRTQNFARSSLK